MLSKPFAGWANFSLNEFTFPVSYLTDVPADFVKALTIALEHDVSTVVVLDGEGEGDCKIVFNTYHDTVSAIHYVPDSDVQIETVFWDESIVSIAEKFIQDIEAHYDDWKNWNYDGPKDIELSNLKSLVEKCTVH